MTIFTTVIFILLATFLLAQFIIAVKHHASIMWILLFGFEILALVYLINNLI